MRPMSVMAGQREYKKEAHVFSKSWWFIAPSIEYLTHCTQEGRPTDIQTVMAMFVERCKKNIHIIACLSPIGDEFRTRLRRFPSLVNCCTIDWFHRWPKEALESVAKKFLTEVDLEEETKLKVVDAW